MNFFSGLFTGVKTLLGFSGSSKGTENVMKVATGIGTWIDERNLTDEEKMKFNGEVIGHFATFMKSTTDENTERSITRRQIAIWVIKLEALFLALYGILKSFNLTSADVWWEIAVDSPWGLLTLGVGAFFFGTHMIRSMQK